MAALRARLHYLEIGSPDPRKLASFYGEALDMAVEQRDDRWLCQGPDRHLVFTQGPPKSLLSAGYAVSDDDCLGPLSARLAAHGVRLSAAQPLLFKPGAVSFRDPDGNLMVYGLPASETPAAGMAARLQHVVVASRDSATMTAFYRDVVGLRESDRVLDDAGDLRTSFLRTDDEHHSFAVFQANESRFDHHCYEAVEWNLIRDWADRFARLRISLKWGPGRHGPGNNLFLFIHDPDGNWIEISAELEIVAPDRPTGTWPHEEFTLNQWGQGLLRS